MPRGPVPAQLDRFLREAHPAVVATVGAGGRPATAATWYTWEGDGRLVLSMQAGGLRHRNLQRTGAVSLTVLAADWYSQVTVAGSVTELRDDTDLADIDAMSLRYLGTPYEDRETPLVTAVVTIDRWSGWNLEAL